MCPDPSAAGLCEGPEAAKGFAPVNNPSQPGPAPLSMLSTPLQQPGGNRLAFLLLGGSLSIGLIAATAMVTTLFFRLSEKT